MRALVVSLMLVAAAVMAMAAGGSVRSNAVSGGPALRKVVLAELFTSEGCSSCPPADALLQRLNSESPVDGVEVLGIEEHVDYWDNLGWRDPFSSAAFTSRQKEYDARAFRNGEIYTPQLVVDGAFDAIGSDTRSVRDAIAKAAARPGANLTLGVSSVGSSARVAVHVDVPPGVDRRKDADLIAAIVEDGLTSHVDRGENRGRTLGHAAVVRSMHAIGMVPSAASNADATADIAIDSRWQSSHLRIVVFVQERNTMRILGAGSASTLQPASSSSGQ